MENKVISNKVYESIQPYTPVKSTTGKVLYANSYAGIPAVAMPKDIKKLLDSDVGLNGTNLLIQLTQKFLCFRNGPWYVDSRDGVIYIHNRKFQEEPVKTYVYQNENGEVLKVQFSTNYITRSQKVMLHESITPEDKKVEINHSTVLDPEKLLAPKSWYNRVDNTYNMPVGGDGWEQLGSHPDQSYGAMKQIWDAQERFNARLKSDKEVKKQVAENPRSDLVNKTHEKIGSLDAKASQKIIEDFINDKDTPEYVKNQLNAWMSELRNCRDPKQMMGLLEKITHGYYYTFSGDDAIEYQTEEWVDPKDYATYNDIPQRDFIDPWYQDQQQRNAGLKNLENDPWIEVVEVEYNKEDIVGGEQIHPAGTLPQRAKIIHKVKRKVQVPIYRFFQNYMARYGGPERYMWAANANANGGLKSKEKVVTCYMTVVGRPLLETSMVINLQNVGKRWSGLWYVKKCTHRMDAGTGYLCDLELVDNNHKAGQTTSRSSIGTENVLHVYTDENGKTVYGKKPASKSSDLTNQDFTREEAVYYGMKYGTGLARDGYETNPQTINHYQAKGYHEATAKKLALDEKFASDPVTKAGGTVRADTIVYDPNAGGITKISPMREMSAEELGLSQADIDAQKAKLPDPIEFGKIKVEAAQKAKRSGLIESVKNGARSNIDALKSILNSNPQTQVEE